MRYEKPGAGKTERELVAQLESREASEVVDALLALVMWHCDYDRDLALCLKLCTNKDGGIRGIAILCFGHMARIHGRLPLDVVRPIVEHALTDPDEFVRGQAHSARDDIDHFLPEIPDGWPFDERPNLGVLTLRSIVDGASAIVRVERDADGLWMFLPLEDVRDDDLEYFDLKTILARDPSIAALADLPPGGHARRDQPDAPWRRG